LFSLGKHLILPDNMAVAAYKRLFI